MTEDLPDSLRLKIGAVFIQINNTDGARRQWNLAKELIDRVFLPKKKQETER